MTVFLKFSSLSEGEMRAVVHAHRRVVQTTHDLGSDYPKSVTRHDSDGSPFVSIDGPHSYRVESVGLSSFEAVVVCEALDTVPDEDRLTGHERTLHEAREMRRRGLRLDPLYDSFAEECAATDGHPSSTPEDYQSNVPGQGAVGPHQGSHLTSKEQG